MQGTVRQTNYEETMLHGVENCKFSLVICRQYEWIGHKGRSSVQLNYIVT